MEAQNLVPNPGFEDYYDCPTQIGQLHLAKHWFSANGGTPEYFNKSCKADWNKPYSGQGYAGLILFGQYTKIIEYIGAELREALIEGEEYRISFQIRPEASPIYIDRIDLALLIEDPSIEHWSPLRLKPSLSHFGKVLKNTEEWTEISIIYTAIGGERFIVLGNFQYAARLLQEANPELTQRKPGWHSYYLIDDVKVEPQKAGIHENPSIALARAAQEIFELRPVQFEFDSYDLSATERLYLDKLIRWVKDKGNGVSLMGHTDALGSESYNSSLSKKRVEGVFNYISSGGVELRALQLDFEGEKTPAASNDSSDGRALNRRVEITLTGP